MAGYPTGPQAFVQAKPSFESRLDQRRNHASSGLDASCDPSNTRTCGLPTGSVLGACTMTALSLDLFLSPGLWCRGKTPYSPSLSLALFPA